MKTCLRIALCTCLFPSVKEGRAQSAIDWKSKFISQMHLQRLPVGNLYLRIWSHHRQVIEFCVDAKEIVIFSYVIEITKNDQRGKVIFGKSNKISMNDSLESEIRNHEEKFKEIGNKYANQYLSSLYEFELSVDKDYSSALIPNTKVELTDWLNSILKYCGADSSYDVFVEGLGPGSYFNGDVTITKR